MAQVPALRKTGRPVGRPPGSSGLETRQQILDAARVCFAANGYTATSNSMVAARAGVTTAAMYHHFGRKNELMLAAYNEAMEANVEAMRTAMAGKETFMGKVNALIDVIERSVVEDPQMAVFTSLARVEADRHDELREIAEDRRVALVFKELIDFGVKTKKVWPRDAVAVRAALAALTLGMAMMGPVLDVSTFKRATASCRKMLEGTMFRP